MRISLSAAFVFLFTLFSCALQLCAQKTSISLPPNTTEGHLANGMHYIVMPNALPRHDIELRLVMRVGSLQENDLQHGGAHFLEHMAFAGTKHLPGASWVDFFERMGMKYGRDINAFTGFDRTIYWLTLPAPISPQLMDTTLLAVRDVLDGINFESQSIESERGVILEELRGYSTGDDFYDLKIGKGIYPKHMPLGEENDIQTISRTELQNFHAKWYLPRYATLIIVGNVNAKDVVGRIEKTFSKVEKDFSSHLASFPLTYEKGFHLQVNDNENATSQRIELITPHPTIVGTTIQTAIEKERMHLLMRAINARFSARGIRCDVSDAWYLAQTNHWVLQASANSRDSLLKVLSRALSECQNIAKRGFSKAELDNVLPLVTQSVKPDTMPCLSTKWVDDFVDYVISGDRYLHTTNDVQLVRNGLCKTTSKQLQKLMTELLNHGMTSSLVAYQRAGEKADTLTTADIEKLWNHSLKHPATPYVFQPKKENQEAETAIPSSSFLTAVHPHLSSAEQKHYEDLGVETFTLQNGLHLVCRRTYEQDSTLYLSLLGRGGLSDLSKEQYPLLKDAASYVDMGGLAHIGTDTLQSIMVGHGLSMSIGIDNHWHQLLASSPVGKAQEMFNLVFEKITSPGRDEEGFNESREEELSHFGEKSPLERMLERDADRMLSRTLDSIVGNAGQYAFSELSKEDAAKVNLDSLTSYYVRLFSNPRQTTIMLTGNFPEETIQCAINTFSRLSLSPSDTLQCNEHPHPISADGFGRRYENSVASQSVLNVVYAGNYSPSLKATLTFKLMRDLLQDRMLSVLRKQMNIVYSPYADLYYMGRPQQTYYFWLTAAVNSANSDTALSAVRSIVEDLQKENVSTAELNKLKLAFKVNKRKSLSDDAPTEWKSILTSIIRNGETLSDFNRYDETLDSITPEDVRKSFCRFINPNHPILLIKE